VHQQSRWTMDYHPSRLIGAPISAILTIFMSDALPGTTLPVYPGLGQLLIHKQEKHNNYTTVTCFFPDDSRLSISSSLFFIHLFWRESLEKNGACIMLYAGYHFCHPTNTVIALKKHESLSPANGLASSFL